jgi:2-polyprenyl-6-methoxyphenol hydroxylase-like FAD-dependent oxidoreductase
VIHTAVVGGGACGLAVARGLWQQGRPVRVYERALASHLHGHGFLLLANGRAALRRLGCDPHGTLGHPITSVKILCCSGQVLVEHPLEGAVAMLRHQLLNVLLRDAPDDLVHYNHPFERFDWDRERARAVCFQNGRSHPADAFVAADGVRSSCRLSLGCGAMTNPGRVKEIVALVRQPLVAAELGHRFLKVLDPSGGLAVGLVPLGDDRLVWFVQFDSQRFTVPQPSEVGAFLEEHFGGFPAVVRHVLAATDPARAHVWHTVDEDPATRWSKGNVALAGDAAHPLLPFTSQGVNTALEDAVVLSDLLLGCRDAADVPELFRAYERQRRPALLGCVEAGRQMARAFVQPSATRLQLPLMA